MSYSERIELIRRLEQVRGSRVICYFLSDREAFPPGIPGFATNLATDSQLLFVDQLHKIGKVQKLDLFLYTRGGMTDAVWPLVTLLRGHCDRLTVLVPFRAHSAGTLICLGADEVILTEAAELSPIDPTTGNLFNPTDPGGQGKKIGISVEDVAAYFTLSTERAGITDQPYKLEIFKELTRKVHPLALGNVQRVYMQIRRLAKRLLALHLEEQTNEKRIDDITEALTEKFYSHLHFIGLREAAELFGEWVRCPTEEENRAIWDLFEAYAADLELRTKFSLAKYMDAEQVRQLAVAGGFIQSTELSFQFRSELKIIQRPNLPQGIQLQVPPGAAVPFPAWATRAYDFETIEMSWVPEKEA